MKRNDLRGLAAAACISMVFGMTACSATAKADSGNAATAGTSVSADKKSESISSEKNGLNNAAAASGMADAIEIDSESDEMICGADESTWSPFTDCDSIEEAEKAAGLDITLPGKIEGFDKISYSAMVRYKLVQAEYEKDENCYFCIRKAVGSEDISGDYNSYREESKFEKNGRPVTLKGNDGMVSLALWTDGAYTYSIMYADLTDGPDSSKKGITAEQMKALVMQVE